MTALRDFVSAFAPEALALGGLGIGVLFGAMANRTGFCTLGAISDWINLGDTRRMRAWALAAAVAILGVAALDAAGVTDMSRTMYMRPRLNWAGSLLGGVMFGFGMALAGGCTSRNLVRAGGGDLRSALTLLMIALFAHMALGGLIGPLRAELEAATATPLPMARQSIGDMVAMTFASDPLFSRALAALIAGLALAALTLASREFRASSRHLVSGVGLGLLVVAGWALTGLAFDEMAVVPSAPPASLTFIRPTAEAIDWLQRFTAQRMPGFGAATVFGAVLGSFLAAIATRSFRVATFADASDTVRHVSGAALMGIGGVMGLGCSIGQGVTGVSTLALGSLLATAAIIGGAILGLKALERWA
jgi:uncharacterized protein